jgi:D-threo-aldose 1-dehydrogenase
MDYRPSAIQASVEQSLRLFRRDTLDRVFLHDPLLMKPEEMAPAIEALLELQRSGKIKSIGIGGNFDAGFVEHATSGVFDCFMGYNKFNAIVQTAVSEEYAVVKSAGLEIWQASPLYMGLLGRRYQWLQQNSSEWISSVYLERAKILSEWCTNRGVSMPALALHYLVGSEWPDRIVLGASGMVDLLETFDILDNPEIGLRVEEWKEFLANSLILGKKV